LWLRDIKDDIEEPHLDFFGGAQQPFTRLWLLATMCHCNERIISGLL